METEQVSEGPQWPQSPFGDFLAFMADKGVPQWVWLYIEVCSRTGVCHSDKDSFILARPVDSTLPIDMLNGLGDINPELGLTPRPDAWHILYASGDIRKFFRLEPFPLPKLIWQRDGKDPVKILNYQRVKERIHGIKTKITKAT